jgi:hypothetical protein
MPVVVLLGEGWYQNDSEHVYYERYCKSGIAVMVEEHVQPRLLLLARFKSLNKLKENEMKQDLTPLYHKYLNAKIRQ